MQDKLNDESQKLIQCWEFKDSFIVEGTLKFPSIVKFNYFLSAQKTDG